MTVDTEVVGLTGEHGTAEFAVLCIAVTARQAIESSLNRVIANGGVDPFSISKMSFRWAIGAALVPSGTLERDHTRRVANAEFIWGQLASICHIHARIEPPHFAIAVSLGRQAEAVASGLSG
jgi:hypothetical protein